MWTALPNGSKIAADVQIDPCVMTPDVGHRQNDVFGECSSAIDANALGFSAKMTAARQTIAAASANHVAFAADDFSGMKISHVRSHFDDFADEFVSDYQRNFNG